MPLWDGLYGVCTNLKEEKAKHIFNACHNLWRIEELFRVSKHTLTHNLTFMVY